MYDKATLDSPDEVPLVSVTMVCHADAANGEGSNLRGLSGIGHVQRTNCRTSLFVRPEEREYRAAISLGVRKRERETRA